MNDLLVRRIFQTHHFGPEEHARSLATLPEEMRAAVQQGPDAAEDFDTETETLYSPRFDAVGPADFDPALGDGAH